MRISAREIRHILFKEASTYTNETFGERPYIRVIQFDVETGVGILRCGHTSFNRVIRLLRELQWRTFGTSGSIKTLKRKFLSKEFK
jgi:RNase P/RNase MRP subunit POP5